MRRLPLPLMILALLGPAARYTSGASPGWQQAGRYWLEAKYQAERTAYDAARDAEYQEGRVLDIAGVQLRQ